MATSAFANVIGKVFTTDHREGFAKETGAAYSMDIIQVLVPGGGLTELVLPSEPALSREALASLEGKDVNFLVEIFRNKYGFGVNVKREVTNTVATASGAPQKQPQHA